MTIARPAAALVRHRSDGAELTDLRCEIDIAEAGYKFHMNNVAAAIGRENLKISTGSWRVIATMPASTSAFRGINSSRRPGNAERHVCRLALHDPRWQSRRADAKPASQASAHPRSTAATTPIRPLPASGRCRMRGLPKDASVHSGRLVGVGRGSGARGGSGCRARQVAARSWVGATSGRRDGDLGTGRRQRSGCRAPDLQCERRAALCSSRCGACAMVTSAHRPALPN